MNIKFAQSVLSLKSWHRQLNPTNLSFKAFFILGILVLVFSLIFAVRTGISGIGYREIFRSCAYHLHLKVKPLPRLTDSLIWDLQLPRVLLSAIIGAMLAICGATLQGVTGNILADPYLLGVSNGASAGAVFTLVLGYGVTAISLSGGAFIGALVAFALMLVFLQGGLQTIRIILTGVVIGQLFASLTSLIIMASADSETTRAVDHWLLGSMAAARWNSVSLCFIVSIVGIVLIWSQSQALDALTFGSDTATSLGINANRSRVLLLILTALITSVAVSAVGAIGFVGLVVPHATRFFVGPLHRIVLPFSAIIGAIFLLWSDTLARTLFAPREIPVGVFTALIGVPLFLIILYRWRKT